MSQMSSQVVNQMTAQQVMAQMSPIYGMVPTSHRKPKKKNVKRKLIYSLPPSVPRPMTIVRPDWNPMSVNAPIYMSPPSIISQYSNSLPRRPNHLSKHSSPSRTHPDFTSNSLRYGHGNHEPPQSHYSFHQNHVNYHPAHYQRKSSSPRRQESYFPSGVENSPTRFRENSYSPQAIPRHKKYGKMNNKPHKSENFAGFVDHYTPRYV